VRIQHDRRKVKLFRALGNVIGRNAPGKNEPGTQERGNAQEG
jgi:hypothetical protein